VKQLNEYHEIENQKNGNDRQQQVLKPSFIAVSHRNRIAGSAQYYNARRGFGLPYAATPVKGGTSK
jgi:hypothetical protein